jgi:hypothetical protein
MGEDAPARGLRAVALEVRDRILGRRQRRGRNCARLPGRSAGTRPGRPAGFETGNGTPWLEDRQGKEDGRRHEHGSGATARTADARQLRRSRSVHARWHLPVSRRASRVESLRPNAQTPERSNALTPERRTLERPASARRPGETRARGPAPLRSRRGTPCGRCRWPGGRRTCPTGPPGPSEARSRGGRRSAPGARSARRGGSWCPAR